MGDNIKVVVRLRPRNESELREPIIVKEKGNSVTVQDRTFHFDKVFGSMDTQQDIFDHVYQGYNCTIFAYGQTGAGKTWTMEGNLVQPSNNGIIPRTLNSLFCTLDKETAEYSVRVSFMELYNEELKDLLSDTAVKLKLFEDHSRKGSVIVQGLEEIIVKNSAEVLELLEMGSLKRQTAATKMNQVSSRSHGIFSITVHIKENTPDGEELLKVGKLNLVDLAGSENIQRSGAGEKRAKEAGMINQSLLTLGRVINALVEHSPHIPYRESKLTRILQDSLGGRTKTCIIAALSPAKCNLEETLSTLDYAHRAKNIRNKPEVNQKMTKRALIREYIAHIDRLKADLNATREKNGIFLSEQSYQMLTNENASFKDNIDEMAQNLKLKEEEMALISRKFKESLALYESTNAKLESSLRELQEKENQLLEYMQELERLNQKALEQEYLKNVHKSAEEKIDQVASGLVNVLDSASTELSALHEKLEKKSIVESENLRIYANLQEKAYAQIETSQSTVNEFVGSQTEMLASMADSKSEFLSLMNDALSKHKLMISDLELKTTSYSNFVYESINEGNQSSMESLHKMYRVGAELTKNVETLTNLISSEHDLNILDSLGNVSDESRTAWESFASSIREFQTDFATQNSSIHQNQIQQLTKVIADLRQKVSELISERDSVNQENESIRLYVQEQKEEMIAKTLSSANMFAENINNRLAVRSDSLECKANNTISRLNALQENLSSLRQQESESAQTLGDFTNARLELVHNDAVKNVDGVDVEGIYQSLKKSTEVISNGTSTLIDQSKSLSCQFDEMLSQSMTSAAVKLDSAKKQIEASQEQVVQIYETLKKLIDQQTSISQQDASNIYNSLGKCKDALLSKNDFVLNTLNNLRQDLDADLLKDTKTGKTPRKRKMVYEKDWERSKDDGDLLEEYRQKAQKLSSIQQSKLPLRSNKELL